MGSIIGLGKYLFAIPFLVFGIFHFMDDGSMASMAPFGGSIMIYITGLAMILAAISIFIGKYDKLACVLLAVLLLLYILLVHAKGLGGEGQQMSMMAILKDLGLMGGALMAAALAKDNSVIG